jgi:putative sterol carrier protein
VTALGSEKKIKFPSLVWLKAYKVALNNNKKYEEVAKNWEGDFLFIIGADDTLKESKYYWLDLWHGKCRDIAELSSPTEKKIAFTYSGPYGNWVKLLQGEIDPLKGIIRRKFRVKGKLSKLLKEAKGAKQMIVAAQDVPTEFLKK